MHWGCLQGFPDYFALVGQQMGAPSAFNSHLRSGSLEARYMQMGNAVCPLVSAAMGRCLARSASHNHPEDAEQFVVSVPDPDYVEVCSILCCCLSAICIAFEHIQGSDTGRAWLGPGLPRRPITLMLHDRKLPHVM